MSVTFKAIIETDIIIEPDMFGWSLGVSVAIVKLFLVISEMFLLSCVQLAIAKNNIIKLQEENQQLRSENSLILLKAQQQLEVHSHSQTSTKSQNCIAVWNILVWVFTAAKSETKTEDPAL